MAFFTSSSFGFGELEKDCGSFCLILHVREIGFFGGTICVISACKVGSSELAK